MFWREIFENKLNKNVWMQKFTLKLNINSKIKDFLNFYLILQNMSE